MMGDPFPSDIGVHDDGAEFSFEDMLDEAPPNSLRLVEPDLHEVDLVGLDRETIEMLRAPRWEVADVAGADWAMRKIRKHRATIATNVELAQRQIDRWRAWVEIENKQYVDDIGRLDGLLRAWAAVATARRLADVGGVWSKLKPKMLRTPSGKIDVKKSEEGRFNGGNAEAQKLAIDMLNEAGRKELVHESKSYSVRATELDAAIASGDTSVRINADGWYEVAVPQSDEASDEWEAWMRLPVFREGRGQISYAIKIDGAEAPDDSDALADLTDTERAESEVA